MKGATNMLKYLKRDEASSAKKLVLESDEGEFYLMVTSTYSDQYRMNKALVYQSMVNSADKIEEKRNSLHSMICAGAVIDWCLPEEEHKEFGDKCTVDAVAKFLFKYPQIADAVDIQSSNDSDFIEKKLKH